MSKLPTLALACALALAAAGNPALSQPAPSQDEIVVSSDAAVAELSRDLDRQLSASWLDRNGNGEGYAIVRFERGADGRPDNVTFYRRSGSGSVDRMARTAVRRLGAERGLPVTKDPEQKFQANIVVANSRQAHKKLVHRLAQAEARRLASSPAERTVLALSAGARIAS